MSHFSRSSLEVEAGLSIGVALSGFAGRLGWPALEPKAGAGDDRGVPDAVIFIVEDARGKDGCNAISYAQHKAIAS